MGANVPGHSSQACVTPLQRDDSSTLAFLRGTPRLCNSPGPEGPVPGAPVAHGTSFTLKLPHLNHAHRCEDGGHLLPSSASLLSSKGSFSGFDTDGRTSPRGAAAKPGGNFMAIQLALLFKAIPKESQEATVGQISCLEGEVKQKSSIYRKSCIPVA